MNQGATCNQVTLPVGTFSALVRAHILIRTIRSISSERFKNVGGALYRMALMPLTMRIA